MREFDAVQFMTALPIILFAIGFHEFSHAKFADLAGDPTPRLMGRVTLNPLAHLDPLGTIMIIFTTISGFGIGWGKPVIVDPRRMKNPRWDHFISVLAGPLSNLLQFIIFAMLFKVLQPNPSMDRVLFLFLIQGVLINLSLCLFNLFPLGPLDGHWLVGAFMPDKLRLQWYRFNRGAGSLILLFIVLVGPSYPQFDLIGKVMMPAARFLLRAVNINL